MPISADKPGGMRRVKKAGRTSAEVGVQQAESVQSAPRAPRWLTTGSVRGGDITIFLRQLIMLLEAGTPLLRSLTTLSERGQNAAQRALVSDIALYVEMGNPLWQAFERHPRYFDNVFINLVKASEASGTLVPVLQRLVQYRDRRESLRKRMIAGMLYPAILVVACFAVILLIAKVIIPTFEDVFAKLNVPLPAMTKFFMAASRFIGNYWWLAIIAVAAFFIVYKFWYVRNPLRRLTADRMKLRLPIMGPILLKNAIVEFTRTMSLLLKSGMSMMATLDLVRNAIHNRAFAHTIQGMRDSVERGGGLEQPMREAQNIIPPVVTDMMVTGEESGRLDNIAEQVANTYEEEVNISIAALSDALQPILTIIIGVMVVLLMLSVFVPLVNMVNQLGAGGA